MAGEFVPCPPAVQHMASAIELFQGALRVTPLDVEQVARFAQGEAAGEPARRFDCLLNVQAEVDHGNIGLELDLRLAVGAHAAEHLPQLVVAKGERCDQRVRRPLARLDPVVMRRGRQFSQPVSPFDKTSLSMGRTIGRLFLLVKGYFASKSRRLAMRLGKEGGVLRRVSGHNGAAAIQGRKG